MRLGDGSAAALKWAVNNGLRKLQKKASSSGKAPERLCMSVFLRTADFAHGCVEHNCHSDCAQAMIFTSALQI